MWEGGKKIFAVTVKYYKYILMGYEISLKIFDEHQNTFLGSSFLSFFLEISFTTLKLWWSEEKMFKGT